MAKDRRIPLIWYRRASQAVFLIAFLYLFRKTDYQGTDEITSAVNIFFRWDPLVAAGAMLAARQFIALVLPAFIVLGITILFGRFFCGWVCPLGTCLDVAHKAVKPRSAKHNAISPRYKYYLLIIILISAALGVSLVGYFDPFSILVRGLATAVDPAFNALVTAPFDFIYRHDFHGISRISEFILKLLKATVLPFRQSAYQLSITSGAILLAVFAMEKIERRFWCTSLCPLGAMLGLFSRLTPLRMQPGKACMAKGCTTCMDVCRMGAIDEAGLVSPEACNVCLDCIEECPKGLIGFAFKRPAHAPKPVDITKRSFVGMLLAGLFVPSIFKATALGKRRDLFLIRPPGAVDEDEFLAKCVRCGECMKVCINNALHPTFMNAGPEGIFSPVLIPRIGGCELNCTLCGQVCPTGAIQRLAKSQKPTTKIGLAYFDKNRCLPWAKGVPCIVCEEMCPMPEKAIKLRTDKVLNYKGESVEVQLPYVDIDLCNGCGVCENKCPLQGASAVRVTSEGESRNPESIQMYKQEI